MLRLENRGKKSIRIGKGNMILITAQKEKFFVKFLTFSFPFSVSMEKGHNLSNSPSSCEKVFSCIVCCKCQTNNDTDHMPTHHNHAGNASDMGHESQKAEAAKNRSEKPSKTAHFAVNRTEPDVKHEGKRSSGLRKNDTFSNYIHRAKMKFRAGSNLGNEKKASEASGEYHIHGDHAKKDNSAKDGFSEYINRVKLKIRKTTTSVRSRKS
ncbi:hypothetical protein G4B88_005172 [Cannabis sativa]|uniref:Uncharacterized protein n=2 Tax=Cannabis sativa TaxID=3483 RepID=A0A7J6DRZ9_CANSA|nr:hypothetical protein G4B88_005172 [Cannabis sativa]